MSILTNEEKHELLKGFGSNILLDLIEATEAAVLEKLKQQKPVEFWLCKSCGYYYNGPVTSCDCMASDAPEMVQLYTTPIPAAVLEDMVKDAERYRWLRHAMPHQVRAINNLEEYEWDEAIDAAMLKGGE